MAISVAAQTLVAAFFFGILLQAASGTLLIHIKGHEGPIFQDGRRLALTSFLLLAALWAMIDFINLNITSSTTACQAALAFSTLSDQLARVGIEQFLLWSVGQRNKATIVQLLLQSVLGIRVIVGVVLVGFTRPDFAPVCVARTSVLPIAVVVLALDVIIIAALTAQILSMGVPRMRENKGLILITIGFALWTGTSAAMLLGIRSIALVAKTTLPSIGLLILVGIIAVFGDSMVASRTGRIIPEVTSPFMTRSLPTAEGIPGPFESSSTASRSHATNGSLYVENPPALPRDPLVATNQGAYLANSRTFISAGMDERVKGSGANDTYYNTRATRSSKKMQPGASSLAISDHTKSTKQEITVAHRLIGTAQRNLPLPSQTSEISQQKRSFFKWAKPEPTSVVRNIGISKPVIITSDSSSQPFAKIKAIDLATAANNERERRENAAARARLIPKRPAPPRPSPTMDAALRGSVSVKRKEISSRLKETKTDIPIFPVTGISLGIGNGSTTSASLSPGHDNVRQRSPRNMSGFANIDDRNTALPTLQRKPTIGLPSNPRSQKMTLSGETIVGKGPIEIHMPDSKSQSSTDMLEGSYHTDPKSSGSILHRPRPYQRNTEKDRALFPSGTYLHHRRSKSGSSITASRKSIFESHPGSPTQLPYLPTPPTRVSELAHILSNNNKSMTFHEKIQFLFPAPPISTLTNKRRSSLPYLPRLASVYMSDASPLQTPVDRQSSRASEESRVVSFETEDIWDSGAALTVADTRNSGQEQSIRSSHTYDVPAFISSETRPSSRGDHTPVQSYAAMGAAAKHQQLKKGRRPEEIDVSAWFTSDDTRQSFLLDANQALPGDKTPSPKGVSSWHRRIGDALPTFSERRKNSKHRKMPPPTPLLLKWQGSGISVVVHSPAPSPVDSPGKAMKDLQARLKRFEEPNQERPSSLRQLPAAVVTTVDGAKDNRNSRSRLLQDLEEEMGQQESLWQKMQNNFDHDSNSIILTPQYPTPSVDESAYGPTQRSVSRRARIRKSMTGGASPSSTSSRSSSNSRASAWQQRLAEAQIEYLDNASALNYNRNMNFLALSQSQIGSPTPPESVDSETDIETSSDSDLELPNGPAESGGFEYCKPSLWQPKARVLNTILSGLWQQAVTPSRHTTFADAPAKNIRPPKRLIQETLPIFSLDLWSKQETSTKVTYFGLWGSRKVRPKSIIVRRASQRPQRKSKRIGYLPDIVESPQPLPHKRDTLGIFQFPSGETSDSAVYHSAFSPALRTVPIPNNVPPDDGVRKSGLDPVEYPSSFFDDYDEQDDSEYLDSDDDFDESTLWEISSLLHSKDFPSNESSPPLTFDTIDDELDFCDDDTCFETTSEGQSIIIWLSTEMREAISDTLIQMPVKPLTLISKSCPRLWSSTSLPNPKVEAKGLPQPDSKIWESYVSKSKSDMRSRSQPSCILPVLTTSALWRPPPTEKLSQFNTSLWRNPRTMEVQPFAPQTLVEPTNCLWMPQAIKFWHGTSRHTLQNKESPNKLWSYDVEAKSKPATCQSNILSVPDAIVHKPWASREPLDGLTSHQLWSSRQVLEEEHHWISESSVRPESPSVQSESSSGGFSPTSDTLSLKSTSTTASSVGRSLKSVIVSLPLDRKFSKNAKSATPDSKAPSASSVSQSVTQRPSSVRESRVLVFRDLFESRTSRSENTPTVQEQPKSNRASLINPTPAIVDYDVATRHPVFFTQSLVSYITDLHPAAIGHFKRPQAAKEGPYISEDHFPTASTASEIGPQLWTSLSAKVESTSTVKSLWSKDSELSIPNKFEHMNKETKRRPTIPDSLSLAVLESSEMWSKSVAVNSTLNWLCTPKATQSHLWSSAAKHENDKNIDLKTVAEYSSEDMFSHLVEDRIRKATVSKPLLGHEIESSRLFESATLSPHSPVHWLHSTSNLSMGPKCSLTWTAPVNAALSEDETQGMWMPRAKATVLSSTLFSNPHAAPWVRKKRYSRCMKDITSSELWRLSTVLPDNPKHWLVDKRISRVQFRY